MNLQKILVGALLLRTETFVELRAQADAFWRGFIVLFIAAALAGAFNATEMLAQRAAQPPKAVVLAQVEAGLASAQIPGGLEPMIKAYVTNSVSLAYELMALPPRAGEWARPFGSGLDWLGNVLSAPFRWGVIGWVLFGALWFGGVAGRLGGRGDLNKMLGLTALAAAPQIFVAAPATLSILAALTGSAALTSLNGWFGAGLALWSIAIYVQAMAVAQNFSVARAAASILIGGVVLLAAAGLLILFALALLTRA